MTDPSISDEIDDEPPASLPDVDADAEEAETAAADDIEVEETEAAADEDVEADVEEPTVADDPAVPEPEADESEVVPDTIGPLTVEAALAAVAPTGFTVVVVADRVEDGLGIAEELGADVVSPGAELRGAVKERLELVKRRATAAERIAEFEASHVAPTVPLKVVTDTDRLRKLATSLGRADRLVARSEEEVRHRLGGRSAGDIAVHPETIKRAAAECVEADQRLEAAAAALLEEETAWAEVRNPVDPWPDVVGDVSGADAFGAVGDNEAQRRLDLGRFGRELAAGKTSEGSTFRRVVGVFTVCVVISLLLVVVINAPLWSMLILPAASIGWGIAEVRDRERDHADRSVALDNLATVSAITDQAYGGVEVVEELESAEPDPAMPQSLVHARARQASASNQAARLRREFEALVGPDVDPHDIDAVLRLRDAQYAVTDHEIQTTPTVRAASGFRRRLMAQWKVAWAAVDQTPPPLDEAERAIRELEARNLHAVTVEKWHEPPADPASLVASDGRTLQELRGLLLEQVSPIVVVSDEDEVDVERVRATCKAIVDETAVVVVV